MRDDVVMRMIASDGRRSFPVWFHGRHLVCAATAIGRRVRLDIRCEVLPAAAVCPRLVMTRMRRLRKRPGGVEKLDATGVAGLLAELEQRLLPRHLRTVVPKPPKEKRGRSRRKAVAA